MGNQQMAYSSNHQPPSVEDTNEWYDSVSDVEENKQQINSPENSVVVNGILDEFIDSLFESKLANSPNEALTSQYLPEDHQHNNTNQTSPTTYGEVALNWKGVAIPPEPNCPDPLPPNKFHVPSSSNNDILREKDSISTENETISLTNTLQDTINDSFCKETKLCKDDGLLLALSQTTNESIESLKELCLESDSIIPLPCPEDSGNSTINENIKAFELTPKDVQTISQSGKCEIFCDSKEIDSLRLPSKTTDKCMKDNCDEELPQEPEDVDVLSTSEIIKAGEEILKQTASYLKQLGSNRKQDVQKENPSERLMRTADTTELDHSQLNLILAARQNTIPELNETCEKSNQQEDKQDIFFNSNVLDHLGVHLSEELNVVPPSNVYSCPETSLEYVTSTNKNSDQTQSLSVVDTKYLQSRKIPEEIQSGVTSTLKQEDAICISNLSSVGPTGELDGLSSCSKDIIPTTSPTDIRQDSTTLKGSQLEGYNLGNLDVSEDLETNETYSVETQDPTKEDEERNILKSMLHVTDSANENVTVPSSVTSTDVQSINPVCKAEEILQNSICTPNKSLVGTLNIESTSEAEKSSEVMHCDNVNDIPSVNELSNASDPLLEDKMSLSYNNETNSEILPEDHDTFTVSSEDTEKSQSFEKKAASHYQDEEAVSSSIPENLRVSSTSALNDIPSHNTEKETLNNTKCAPLKSPVDILNAETESFSPESEEHVEVNLHDNVNSITEVCEFSGTLAPLIGGDKKPSSYNSNTISAILSKDADTFNTSLEQTIKVKNKATIEFQDEEASTKFSELCSQMEVNNSITENLNNSSATIPNDVPSSNTEKETISNTTCAPSKSPIGVMSVKAKSFSPETKKDVEVRQCDKVNCIVPKDELSDACTPLLQKEKRLLSRNSSAVSPVDSDMFSLPIEERRKFQSSERDYVCSQQHEDVKRKSNESRSQIEKLENISYPSESAKDISVSIDTAILSETKQYRNLGYEEENICDLDDVINQFRLKHKPENAESYSKLDRRKDLLDKISTKKSISDRRKMSGKNMERSNFQTFGECKKEVRVPDIKNQNVEDISVRLDKHECKMSSISSQNNPKEQNSENVLTKGDIVNFRGIVAGEEVESVQPELKNDPRKCSDVIKERETVDPANNSNMNVDTKKERMPELKPETLKSLIADLSLNKSTTDVGCNTVEDWTKKDTSKVEADWLKERKKLIGRITDLHQTQNATKFIVKELIYIVTSWMEGKDKDNVDLQETRQKLISERDQALEDLRSVEESFYELHRRYEKTKKLIEDYKKNEDILKRQIADEEEKLQQQKQMFDRLVKHSEEKLEQANAEILNMGKSKESEIAVLTAQLRKAEMKAKSLEKALEQKVRENTELSSICEDLITKCGRK